MRRVTIAVIGNAKTTRANLEALINDFVDSVDETHLAVIYKDSPSEGQVWTIQLADDNIPIAEYKNNDYDKFFADNAGREIKFFLLYDENDEASVTALIESKARSVPSYDLTDGLLMLGTPPLTIVPVAAPEPVVEAPTKEELDEFVEAVQAVRDASVPFDKQYILSKLSLISTMVEEVKAALSNE